jgi:hypothetical protein
MQRGTRVNAVSGVGSGSPNKRMQRAGHDKVHGRGRFGVVLEQVCSARVLMRQRAVADGCRWASLAVERT